MLLSIIFSIKIYLLSSTSLSRVICRQIIWSGLFCNFFWFGSQIYNLFDHSVFFAINFNQLGNIPALSHDKFDLILRWCSKNLPFPSVNDTFYRFIVTVPSIVGSRRNVMGILLLCLLSRAWRSDTIKILLIEPSVTSDTMLPILGFKGEIIIENVLTFNHFSLFPYSSIVASLNKINWYIWID